MKQPLQHILFAAVVLLATACGHSGNVEVKTDGALSDSTTRQIERIGEMDTTRAFRMLDSLYERGEMAEHTYYYTRARVYQGTPTCCAVRPTSSSAGNTKRDCA